MIDVCLLGTGGMMPLPDRFLTSLYVRSEGHALLIDCGESTQTAIRTAGLRFKPIKALLITHFHADHVSGLPGLLLTLGNEDRTEKLDIYGPVGLKRVISSLRAIVPDLPYPLECHEIGGESEFEAAGLKVTCFEGNHRVPCLGYVLKKYRPGRFDPEKAARGKVPMRLWGRLQSGESAEGFVPSDVLGEPRRGLKLVYSTDTLPVEAVVRLGEGADLMVLEGMFGGSEKDERALFTCHSTMNQAAELARRANARRLWYTHYSPANPHPEDYEEELSGIFPGGVISTDGQSMTLRFDD